MKKRLNLRSIAIVLGTLFVFSVIPLNGYGESNVKLGYIDLQDALSSSLAGKRAAEKLKKDRDALLEAIKAKEDELRAMQEQLSKQASLLTEETLKDKQDDFRRRMKEYDRFKTDSAQEWENKKKELEDKILSGVIKVVEELGKKKGFTIIFAREQGVLYASDAIDLTKEVIAAYDASQK